VDVFAKGSDSQLWHKWWDGVQWNGWESLGGNLTSGPAAASTAPGELNVVAVGAGSVPERSLYSNGWFGWQPMGGLSAYTPASTPLDSGSQDVFVTGTDGQLWYGQLAITTQPPSMMPVARPYAAAARL
jgi:hypothetical protein